MAVLDIKKWMAKITQSVNPVKITTLTFNQCTTGSYTRYYKIGRIVILSFNINITTATTSYDYITGLPLALDGGWGCAGVTTGGSSIRFWVTTNGTLRADGTTYTGWYNGNVVYICQ